MKSLQHSHVNLSQTQSNEFIKTVIFFIYRLKLTVETFAGYGGCWVMVLQVAIRQFFRMVENNVNYPCVS